MSKLLLDQLMSILFDQKIFEKHRFAQVLHLSYAPDSHAWLINPEMQDEIKNVSRLNVSILEFKWRMYTAEQLIK